MMSTLHPTSTVGSRRSHSAEQTHSIGMEIGTKLRPGSVLALRGELGAGKTTLIGGVVEAILGPGYVVDSPTFTYLNIYENKVFHFDLYRLESARQFLDMGFEEFLFTGVACIEWSERIALLLPPETVHVELVHEGAYRCITSAMFAS